MSRPRYFWYGFIVECVKRFPLQENTPQGVRINSAIIKAMNSLQGDRRKAVQMVYIDKTHTRNGTALYLNVSERTLKTWLSEFIYDVAKHSEFLA